MSAILVDQIEKTFRQKKHVPGAMASLRAMFTPTYIDIRAVDGVSFQIAAGDTVGYLGPNGAGKSTMMKMMTGILVPSGGRLTVLGRTPHKDRRSNAFEIGVVFGQRSQLWWDLPAVASFELSKRMHRIPEAQYMANLGRFTDMLDLGGIMKRPVRKLSLGQRMRCEIVMALLHSPKILFLDEPTIGLDVVAKEQVRNFLREINCADGVTLFLTSHDMQDIESLCSRMLIVDNGKLIFDGDLPQLRDSMGAMRRLKLQFAHPVGPFEIPGLQNVAGEGLKRDFLVTRKDILLPELLALLPANLPLADLRLEDPNTDDIVRDFYRRKPDAHQRS
ncbi:ABC transporter ATP-binding protein (plasmid) [Sinorhizobium meliloti]|uniref:ABC transporter ATP-binding protein n=1 Tax=Rhizobium meliloti TaxID=382 RepID=UPI000B49FDB7|nr:ATP-binding cassette domain-containing protein [Sinorhizobium meliloti]ASP76480.1 ABC transporter ATP-binding protein [Sinorhizobium meliloti]MDE3856969.1 ATP-binding cassette domain-containing protein [Sinorhizobium meliloti]MQW48017.1 ATP-binding cassette domain-containing protein [Sinorhizobium meliloti]